MTPATSLSASQLNRLHQALVAAFSRDELRQLVALRLEADFSHLTGEKGYADQVFELVQWARRQDRIGELLKCAHEERPRNEALAALYREARRHAAPTIEWITVPAGDFVMGSDPARDPAAKPDEFPLHTVFLPEYRIARFPVTVALFKAFVDATGYRTTVEDDGWVRRWSAEIGDYIKVYGASWRNPHGPNTHVLGKLDHPATCISFPDAVAFCQWAGVRLATEAEWEKAARGTDGRIYPWGDETPTDAHCLCAEVSDRYDTVPVGKHLLGSSPYGVMSMSGNVYEWTSSLARGYPYRADDGREDPSDTENRRVLRGGGYTSGIAAVRCACRNQNSQTRVYAPYGFRVVA